MNYSVEVSKFISRINDETADEEAVSDFFASLIPAIGAFIYINLEQECHEQLIDHIAASIKQSTVNAASDPGMQFMQMVKAMKVPRT
ncbi:hypothetical protein D3C75_560980 [compost metagenome]